jgi:hypothetical protein
MPGSTRCVFPVEQAVAASPRVWTASLRPPPARPNCGLHAVVCATWRSATPKCRLEIIRYGQARRQQRSSHRAWRELAAGHATCRRLWMGDGAHRLWPRAPHGPPVRPSRRGRRTAHPPHRWAPRPVNFLRRLTRPGFPARCRSPGRLRPAQVCGHPVPSHWHRPGFFGGRGPRAPSIPGGSLHTQRGGRARCCASGRLRRQLASEWHPGLRPCLRLTPRALAYDGQSQGRKACLCGGRPARFPGRDRRWLDLRKLNAPVDHLVACRRVEQLGSARHQSAGVNHNVTRVPKTYSQSPRASEML